VYLVAGAVAGIAQVATNPGSAMPMVGASGAIAGVTGAYFVFYPNSRVLGLIVVFPVRISAWFFLGFWFLYQLYEANVGLFSADAHGGGVAFFAHVGGFVFGLIVAWLFVSNGRFQDARTPVGAQI